MVNEQNNQSAWNNNQFNQGFSNNNYGQGGFQGGFQQNQGFNNNYGQPPVPPIPFNNNNLTQVIANGQKVSGEAKKIL